MIHSLFGFGGSHLSPAALLIHHGIILGFSVSCFHCFISRGKQGVTIGRNFLKRAMIIIRYSEWDAQLGGLERKAGRTGNRSSVLSQTNHYYPIASGKGKIIQGEEAITAFLKQLEKDINDWRTPRCGV